MLHFGSYILTVTTWDNRFSLLGSLRQCDDQILMLGEQADTYVSIVAQSEDDCFGIGIPEHFVGIKSGMLLDYEHLNLVLGYENSVAFINLPDKKLIVEHTVGNVFYQFHTRSAWEFFIAQYETDVAAFSYEGNIIWHYAASDIITGFEFLPDQIGLKFMDLQNSVTLNLLTGEPH